MTYEQRVSSGLLAALRPMQGDALYADARRAVLAEYQAGGLKAAQARARMIVANFKDVQVMRESLEVRSA